MLLRAHGPEFEDFERLSIPAHPLLPEHDTTALFEPQNCGHSQQGQAKDGQQSHRS